MLDEKWSIKNKELTQYSSIKFQTSQKRRKIVDLSNYQVKNVVWVLIF